MNRHVQRVDTHHDRIGFEMQSASERDGWQRALPDPMPSTHELYHEWDPETCTVWIGVRLKPGVTEEEAKHAMGSKPRPGASSKGPHAYKDLMKLSVPDLETLATEMGIAVAPTWKKPAYVSAILDHQKGQPSK